MALASLLPEDEQRACYLNMRQVLVDCEGMDPLLIMTLALGEYRLRSSTLYGDWMMRHVGAVVGVGDDAEMTPEQLAVVARDAASRFRLCPVRAVQRSSILVGTILPRIVVREAKKAAAIERFMDRCDAAGMEWCCASLVQIKYPSGARVHQIHSHPSEFLIWCKDMVVDRARTALVLMEVPNRLQMLHCFYVDWDMIVDDFTFASEPGAWPGFGDYEAAHGADAGLEYVRSVAMGTPRVICDLLADAGYVAHGQVVQVVVVEGTRGRKVGIHFIFKTLSTREMHRDVWAGVLGAIERRVGRQSFREVMRKRDEHVVDAESMRAMGGGLFCLIGMDMHPMQTIEQGLALPFSRKNPEDPLSRPVAIIHVEAGGEELFWEVPCRRLWIAGSPIRGPHPDVVSDCSPLMVLASLLDASICIPGPRCIALVDGVGAPKNRPPVTQGASGVGGGGLCQAVDESSTCSTSSFISTVASWASNPWGNQRANTGPPTLRQRAAALWERVGGGPGAGLLRNPRPAPEGACGEGDGVVAGARGVAVSDSDTPIPGWFMDAVRAVCPDFDGSVYATPRYGSRPSCTPRGGRMFQVNKSAMSMCVWEACKVPFSGFRSHTNNGTLFYVDGEDVYASCMSKSCHEKHLQDRERNWHMSRRIEALVLHGDEDACTAEEISRHPLVAECLRDQDVDFLAGVAGGCLPGKRRRTDGDVDDESRRRRPRQFDLGCHDFYHGRWAPSHGGGVPPSPDPPVVVVVVPRFAPPRGFVPVPPCRRRRDAGRRAVGEGGLKLIAPAAPPGEGSSGGVRDCFPRPKALPPPGGEGSSGGARDCSCGGSDVVCASEYVGVPSIDRWNALDGKRTWVRVTRGMLEAHLRSVAAVRGRSGGMG